MIQENFYLILISAIFVATASGLVGSFLVLRRMTLLSDALSHVALPGIAIGILLNFQPLIGGLAFLFLGILLIWGIETKTHLAIESITGVLFVTALAIGALLMPEVEILETFFGEVTKINLNQAIIEIALSSLIIFLALYWLRPLILFSIAPELATASKISQNKMQFILLSLIALTIAIGISFVGILLMSALSIIPALTARNIAGNLKSFLILSIALSITSLLAGLFAPILLNIEVGIATVLLSASFFLLSLLSQRKLELG